jgi:hypothetical protein
MAIKLEQGDFPKDKRSCTPTCFVKARIIVDTSSMHHKKEQNMSYISTVQSKR